MTEEKFEAVILLPDNLYGEHKPKFQRLRKKWKLLFDKQAYLDGHVYIWKNDFTHMIGEFKKDDKDVTIQSAFIVREDESNCTGFYKDMCELAETLGGKCITIDEYRHPVGDNGLAEFDQRWHDNILGEELAARRRGYETSPLLSPMINQYLRERAEQFNSPTTRGDVENRLSEALSKAEERE